MVNPRLTLHNISVEFTGLLALDHVNLELGGGEIVGLIGPNGSGKSTLVNAITGHVKTTHGKIQLGETILSDLNPRKIALKGISRSFQIVRLFGKMTVLENIEVAALAQGLPRKQARKRALMLLEEFDLISQADELADILSYGDKRRVEIARALAADPLFLLLDEPAAGMNDNETQSLRQILEELPKKRGLGLLIIDHDMGLMMKLCHRLHVLASGRTLAQGDSRYIRTHPDVIEAYLGKGAIDA